MVSIRENYKNNLGKHINFYDAQKLFNSYSPLKTNADLNKVLYNILGEKYIELALKYTPRELCNEIVFKYYPNETSVKAAFINKILMKTENHISIFELSVGSSRADLCKINGTSIAYEIKTDLDNLHRLKKQLVDYMQVFEKVYVICSSNKVERITDYIPEECGIYVYKITKSGNYKFKIYKNAKNSNCIVSEKQLAILTKRELHMNFNVDLSLIKEEQLDSILHVNNADKINQVFKKCLKQKYKVKWDFLKERQNEIYDIDYQWFFKYTIEPTLIYQ